MESNMECLYRASGLSKAYIWLELEKLQQYRDA